MWFYPFIRSHDIVYLNIEFVKNQEKRVFSGIIYSQYVVLALYLTDGVKPLLIMKNTGSMYLNLNLIHISSTRWKMWEGEGFFVFLFFK